MKLLSLIFVSNSIWYLERSDLTSSSITYSVLSLIIISMMSLFESITHSSSIFLWETKLIVFVSWIFHVSDFLRLFRIFSGMV